MPMPARLGQQANDKRNLAAQARRWARQMTQDADRDHLLRIAVELEAEAAELDRQATAPITQVQPPGYSQPVQQAQQQQQQQGPEGPRDDEKRED